MRIWLMKMMVHLVRLTLPASLRRAWLISRAWAPTCTHTATSTTTGHHVQSSSSSSSKSKPGATACRCCF